MIRLEASLLLLLLSGADAFLGPGGVGSPLPSKRRCLPSSTAARSDDAAFRPTPDALLLGRDARKQQHLYSCGLEGDEKLTPVPREESRLSSPPSLKSDAIKSTAKHTLATMFLAAILVPSVFIGGVALPSMGGAGVGSVAPAYAELEPLPLKSYSEEFSSALAPVNTVRGLWRTRETRNDGSTLPEEAGKLGKKGICRGRLSFKGFVGVGKGTVEYEGCGARVGKGRWLTKPKNVVNGRITLSARWKIKFSDGTSLLYRGDVVQDAEGTALTVDATGAAAKGGAAFARPDAHIRGEVLRPVTNIQGSLSEKKIGEFEADLIELPSDSDTL